MRTPLSRTPEFRPETNALVVSRDQPDPLLIAAALLLNPKTAHQRLKVSAVECTRWANSEEVQRCSALLERAVRQQVVQSGDADAATLARAEAPTAMRRIIALATSAPDAKVQLQANAKVLDLAGVVAPKPKEQVGAQELIDTMTADELERYIATNEWPARFGDHLRRLALRRQLVTHQAITVDAEIIEEDETVKDTHA